MSSKPTTLNRSRSSCDDGQQVGLSLSLRVGTRYKFDWDDGRHPSGSMVLAALREQPAVIHEVPESAAASAKGSRPASTEQLDLTGHEATIGKVGIYHWR